MKIMVETMLYTYMTTDQPRVEYETWAFKWDQQNKKLICPNGQVVPNMDELEKVFKRIKGHFSGTSYYIKDMYPGFE